MRISDRELERRLRAIQDRQGVSEKLRKVVSGIDICNVIADCYYDLHNDVLRGDHTFYNLPGGRGSGKSSYVALELISSIMKDPTGLCNALVVRKWAVTLRRSVFSQLQWAIDTLRVSQYWKSTIVPLQLIYKPTGQVIMLTGLDDPQKLKSLKPSQGYFRFLWLEEFSEITGEPELRNLQQSVLRGGESFTVFRSFNPPISSANWVNKYVLLPDSRSLTFRTDYRMLPAEWLGQPFIDEAERLKEVNPRAYEHEYLGLPVGNGSEVFPGLEVRTITDEELQNQVQIFQGIDFGFASDALSFVRLAYDRKTETIYFIDEFYKTHCSNADLAREIINRGYHLTGQLYAAYGGEVYQQRQLIIADSAEPKSIADLRGAGLKVVACHKEPGCVQYRTRWLQHRKIIIDPERTPESCREFQNYCYVVDRTTGEITSELPDKDNHSIDATAYALDRQIYSKRESA